MTASVCCLGCRKYVRFALPAPGGSVVLCPDCAVPLDPEKVAQLNALATDPEVRAALDDLVAVAAAEEEADRSSR